jgi:DNA-directed RNA polymerase alpha subunit
MQVKRTRIEDLNLGRQTKTRIVNCLRGEGIEFADQLSDMTPKDLLMIPNFGKESYLEILDGLCQAGFNIPFDKRTKFDFAN